MSLKQAQPRQLSARRQRELLLPNERKTTVWRSLKDSRMLLVMCAPAIIFFLWAQRGIVSGLTAGSVKG